MPSTNLAGRAGRWGADNWKKAFFGWLVFAVAAVVIGTAVGHKQVRGLESASGRPRRRRMLEQAGFKQPANEIVLIQSRNLTVADRVHLRRRRRRADAPVQKNVTNIQDPRVKPGGGGQISRDGHSVLVQFTITGEPTRRRTRSPLLDAIAACSRPTRPVVREVGTASADRELDKRFKKTSPTPSG